MTPTVSAALGIGRVDSLNDVARVSDFVSVHVALTDETRGMIGKEFFDHMQDGAGFINTSRAEVVQQDALLGALNEGRIMAGLDVFEDEPAPSDQEYHGVMKDAPNAYCTHHIGASTEQAQEAVAEEVVHIVSEYVQKGHAPNVVNIPAAGDREWLMTVRHANKVGVLSYVLGLLKDDEVNVLEVENIILGTAAIAQIAVDRKPSDKTMEDISIYRDIFDASLTRIDLVS
jgi:D-3-phosphoglycerate dehydrogenase